MKLSKITLLRLLASGALLGVIVAGMFGVDLSSGATPSVLSGLLGAGGSAVVLKLVHLL
ncbi:hypothetical protein [Acidovorax sp. NCPPB 4044]|uniref:hypothetical protein n=1 Tax=Acidovorax sp. NCPPB 4044 TaxID=2940490 RepID=UPI002303F098|nr:hypothetical protein [Acidovorax sp. NCPPB 4044]MDA8521352.1 hypothetical protein [Acidovorax sp. NCPPB 4044]